MMIIHSHDDSENDDDSDDYNNDDSENENDHYNKDDSENDDDNDQTCTIILLFHFLPNHCLAGQMLPMMLMMMITSLVAHFGPKMCILQTVCVCACA